MANAQLAKVFQRRFLGDYTNLLRNLLPTGILWKNLSNTFWLLLESFAAELERIEARFVKIQNEAIPGLSEELIDRWEKVVLLPSEIPVQGTPLAERQNIVHTKYYTFPQVTTEQFFITYAESLGIVVTIGTHDAFRVGISRVGERIYGAGAAGYVWIVNHTGGTDAQRKAMKEYFLRVKPAHTSVEFVPPIP